MRANILSFVSHSIIEKDDQGKDNFPTFLGIYFLFLGSVLPHKSWGHVLRSAIWRVQFSVIYFLCYGENIRRRVSKDWISIDWLDVRDIWKILWTGIDSFTVNTYSINDISKMTLFEIQLWILNNLKKFEALSSQIFVGEDSDY